MRSQETGNVTYLGTCDGNTMRELAQELDAGNVTHAVAVYRCADGDVHYRTIGDRDLTYLIGMLERAQVHMHCSDAYVLPDP